MNTATSGAIRVQIPFHLQTLAGIGPEITLSCGAAPTIQNLLDTLEAHYPSLQGAVYEQEKGRRRPLIRFFACQRDLSFVPLDTPLPLPVVTGLEPFLIVGAIAGG